MRRKIKRDVVHFSGIGLKGTEEGGQDRLNVDGGREQLRGRPGKDERKPEVEDLGDKSQSATQRGPKRHHTKQGIQTRSSQKWREKGDIMIGCKRASRELADKRSSTGRKSGGWGWSGAREGY